MSFLPDSSSYSGFDIAAAYINSSLLQSVKIQNQFSTPPIKFVMYLQFKNNTNPVEITSIITQDCAVLYRIKMCIRDRYTHLMPKIFGSIFNKNSNIKVTYKTTNNLRVRRTDQP